MGGKLNPPSSTALLLSSSFLLFCFPPVPSHAQQGYLDNKQMDCYATNGSTTLGYSCNGQRNSCSTFVTFRSQTLYQSPVDIGYLLNADTLNISTINGVTDFSQIPIFKLVLVPSSCSCSGHYYQHNASYTLKADSETYFTIANETFQGLSTCQGLVAQNYDSRNLSIGEKLVVPLRCACPTASQTANVVKYLLNYLITWGDEVSVIAQRFGVDSQSILDANGLSSDSTIYPFTTLLVPLKTEPPLEGSVNPSPPPSPLLVPLTMVIDKGSSNHKLVCIGIGIGVVLLALCGVVVWLCHLRHKPIPQGPKSAEHVERGELEEEKSNALASSELYKYKELETATGSFRSIYPIMSYFPM